MIHNYIPAYVAVISHKRPQNVQAIQKITGAATFFVNKGESESYYMAGAVEVVECGTDICQARNEAIKDANRIGLPCIQVSDDLRGIKLASINQEGKTVLSDITFELAVKMLIDELKNRNFFYGGVAINNNRLNYTGIDASYNKLIVNDLICMMPGCKLFDETVALKEDYDMSIRSILEDGGLVRLNNILCDFPHRQNDGGANTYRNKTTEDTATAALYVKWGNLIKPHPTRPGQISLNYAAIQQKKNGQQSLF